MAKIKVNDLFEEMREENNRLLNDLKYSQKCFDLFEKYRKYLINLNNNCICDEFRNKDYLIQSLESKYKSVVKVEHQIQYQIRYKIIDNNVNQSDENPIQLIDKSVNFIETNKLKQLLSQDLNEKTTNEESVEKQIQVLKIKEELKDIEMIGTESEDIDNEFNYYSKHCIDLTNNEFNNEDISDSNESNDSFRRKCVKTRIKKRIKSSVKPKKKYIYPKRKVCEWPGCGKKFRDNTRLSFHMNTHTKQKPFECDLCDKKFASKNNLYVHQIVHKRSEKRNFRCDWAGCESEYRERRALLRHQKTIHLNESPNICLECNKLFTTQTSLKYHQKLTHSQDLQTYRCEYSGCTYETKNMNCLKSHSFIHKNIRNFKCDESGCGMSFRFNSALKGHKRRVHSDERPFECDWPGCESRFKERDKLNDHRLRHLAVKQFKCDFKDCGKMFVSKKNLWSHKREHIKPYLCSWPACDQRFGSKRSLTTHLNRHQNLRPHKCAFIGCNTSCFSKPLLNHHIKQYHNK